MSNKLEAALGGKAFIEFVDQDDEVFRAEVFGSDTDPYAAIELSRFPEDGSAPSRLVFYKADATKIIALIAEAAK